MYVRTALRAASLGLAVVIAAGSAGAQTPKRGGTLTYMIPADSAPSQTTVATAPPTNPDTPPSAKRRALGTEAIVVLRSRVGPSVSDGRQVRARR